MPAWIAPLKPFLSALLLPPGLTALLLTLGLCCVLRAKRRLALALLGIGVAALWLGQSVAVARWLQQHLLHVPPALDAAAVERLKTPSTPTAIIVLGGGLNPDAPEYHGAAVLSEYSFLRLRYGAWLARQTGLPMGFSGGAGWSAPAGAPSEAQAAAVAATEWGQRLRWVEPRSRDTRENARMSLPLLEADGIREIVLVTEAAHMPRALRAFEAAAGARVRITPAPTLFIARADQPLLEWLPTARGQRLVSFTLHEWLGWWAGA
jgi:uncharacterized SAM-binding protein YcdF (DUF218 family)